MMVLRDSSGMYIDRIFMIDGQKIPTQASKMQNPRNSRRPENVISVASVFASETRNCTKNATSIPAQDNIASQILRNKISRSCSCHCCFGSQGRGQLFWNPKLHSANGSKELLIQTKKTITEILKQQKPNANHIPLQSMHNGQRTKVSSPYIDNDRQQKRACRDQEHHLHIAFNLQSSHKPGCQGTTQHGGQHEGGKDKPVRDMNLVGS